MTTAARLATGVPVLCLLVAGCATQDVEQTVPVAAAVEDQTLQPIVVTIARPSATLDELDCREEVVTGTHRDREICLTRAERDAARRAAQEWLRSGGFSGGATNPTSLRTARSRNRTPR